MADPSPNPTAQPVDPDLSHLNGATTQPADIMMSDSTVTSAQNHSPAPQHPLAQTATPAPPTAPVSSRNSPHPSAPAPAPTQAVPHGSPTRVYLNQHVTPHLLEAMKHLATTEPEKPLKWLSEFLAQKSMEVEGA